MRSVFSNTRGSKACQRTSSREPRALQARDAAGAQHARAQHATAAGCTLPVNRCDRRAIQGNQAGQAPQEQVPA